MKAFIGFFVHRPLLVNLIMVFSALAGFAALNTLNYNVYPEMDVGGATITTLRPGASAQDVELSVTTPLEEEILKVDGIDKLVSKSMEGMSSILVRMHPDNSKEQNDQIESELQRAIDRAYARMPDDLPEKPDIERHKPDRIPVMQLLVTGKVPEETLRTTARQLSNALREVEGIGGVSMQGYRKKEVRILLDADRMHHLGVSAQEIQQAILRRNLRDSGGSLESFVSEQDVLTIGQFQDPKDVETVIIRSAKPGDYVRIRDIAQVVYDYEDWTIQSSTDGETGITLLPRTQAGADGLRASNRIRAFIHDYEKNLPPGVKITILNDMSRFTRDMLNVLTSNAGVGFILVFLVLLAFFPFRIAGWVTIGVPVALLMVFAAMPFINISVNQLSLGGLILMLGLLVDDAIVTSESILRHSERGMNARDAAIHGTAAVAPPVITSVATTILAFAPAAFLGGIEGKFMWMAPAMAMLALSASLIECKMLLPSHMHHALSRHTNDGSRFSRSWFDPVEAFYRRQMTRLLPHRYKTMMVFLAIFAGITFLGIKLVNVNLYPDYEVDAFYVQAELPMGSSFDNTREKLEAIDRIVRDIVPPQDLLNISLTVGHHDYDPKEETSGYHSAWGMVSIYLKSIDERESDTLELIRETRQRLKGYGDFTRITVVPQRETPPVGRAVEVEIIGNDDNRYELADTLTRWLRNHPGTTEVWTSHTLGKDVIELQLHHERMADYGLQTSDITTAVRLAFDGLIIDELQTVDERIRYRLQLAKPDQGRLESLRSLPIINHEGKPVPLRAVVDFDIRPGEATIKHYFGDRTLTVFAEIDRDSTSTAEINEELQSYINDHQVLEGYHQLRLHFGGEYEQQSEAVSNVGFAFMLCLAGIVFLLVILFNSATQPFLVLSILPLGLAGVVFAFATHGMDLSMSALTGTIGLMGVLVNDSLVMIDRLNNYRNELPDASHFMTDSDIVNGASQRLRAIFITTTTTVAGLFPAAYGLAGENPFITPMIMAMIWGVLFGSFVTLVYLPCLYAMEQDFRKWLARKTQPTTH